MAIADLRQLAGASLRLDAATLTLAPMPRRLRARLLASKMRHLPTLLAGRQARLRIGPTDYHAATVSDLGTMQSSITDVYRDLVAPGILDPHSTPVVVDVGANIGQFAHAIKLACPGSRLICLEPDPATWRVLRRNTEAADLITTLCAAAGAAPGRLPLHRHELSVMSSLCPPRGREGYRPNDTVDVAVTTLDDALADVPAIDLVKIDVEGAEADVLRGAAETLRRTRYLLLELTLAPGNLATLDLVRQVVPGATIIRFGRPLGARERPVAQDVIISLRPGPDDSSGVAG
jgi:FkbM family methyltransferase